MSTYDGSFGTGDISTEATIRELTGIAGTYVDSVAAIDTLMTPPSSGNFEPASGDYSYTASNVSSIVYTPYQKALLDLNPAVFYYFNEVIGETVAVDQMGNSDGTYVNTPTLEEPAVTPHDPGTAVKFDGSNDYIETNYSRYLGDLTVSTTIFLSFRLPVLGTYQYLLSTERTDWDKGTVAVAINSDKQVEISVEALSSSPYNIFVKGSTTLETDTNYTIAIVLSPTRYAIYLNGGIDADVIPTHTNPGSHHAGIEIGRLRNYTVSTLYGNFYGDNFAIFETALSEAQINTVFSTLLTAEDFEPESANYSYSGSDILIVRSPPLNFEPVSGEYSYNGTDTLIKHNRPIVPTSGDIPYSGSDVEIVLVDGARVFKPQSGDYSYDGPDLWIAKTVRAIHQHATTNLWHEGYYPPFEYVPNTLPYYTYPGGWTGSYTGLHWGPADLDTFHNNLVSTCLVSTLTRNDKQDVVELQTYNAVTAEAPLQYFYGCTVHPTSIEVPGVIDEDYFVPITISNNHLAKSIEVRDIFVLNDPFGTMTVTPQNWPRFIPPYSFVTYTLKISATEGYPEFEATLVVDAGTCYTEIPITGQRNVDCPECPPLPPPCPEIVEIPEDYDMAQCMVPQQLCAITRGDRVPFNLIFARPVLIDGVQENIPINIGGKTIDLEIRRDIKDILPVVKVSKEFPIDEDSRLGRASMALTPTDTLKLKAGITYCFKFVLNNGPSQVSTIGRGTLPVNPDPVGS